MTVALAPSPVFSWVTPQGEPAVGYQLFTYVAGTSTPQATYTDSTGLQQNLNPVVLNAYGFASVWLTEAQTYKLILQDLNGNVVFSQDQIPGGAFAAPIATDIIPSIDNTYDIGSPSLQWKDGYFGTSVQIAGNPAVSYPLSAIEISAGITPTDFLYPPNHIFRYINDLANVIAGTSTVDNSTGAQDWLTTCTPGCEAILEGTVRAQGLVLRISDVRFTGGGWLKPVSNTTVSVLQLGEDSSSTALLRITGSINVGDSAGSVASWPLVRGLAVQAATGCTLGVSAVGLGIGLYFNPTVGAAAYSVFLLGSMFNNTIGLQFNPTSTGYCNENTFIGGRYTINSSTWNSNVIYVQSLNAGSNNVNNIRMMSPSFEYAAQVLDWAGTNLTIENGRWETGALSGTAGTNFASVFWNFASTAIRNRIDLSYNTQWLVGSQAKTYTTGLTAVGVTEFQIAGSDERAFFPRMQMISVTVSGTSYLCVVNSSTFSGGNTQVFILNPIVTGAPTSVIAPRVNDAGLVNTIKVSTADVGANTWQAEAGYNRVIALINSMIQVAGAGGFPALTLSDQSSSNNDVLRVIDFAGTGLRSAGITSGGSVTGTKLGVGGATPQGSVTGFGTPVGGAVVSSYNITDAGGANSNTNKLLAKIAAVLIANGILAA